jgi:ribosomal protein S18 acetylase RimI-like enzyme
MNTVIRLVRERGGRDIILQVEKDNGAAVLLYHTLNFETVGSMTTWRTTVSAVREIPRTTEYGRKPYVRELSRDEWQAAYELDLRSLHPDLNWPDTLPSDSYRSGFWNWIERLLTGRRSETWVIASRSNQLLGLASIWNEWGRPHRLSIRVLPEWRGKLERPLFAKLIRRLQNMPRRNVRLEHPDDDECMNQLLREANFKPRRTLTHMRLQL